jgi:hypothetical protein
VVESFSSSGVFGVRSDLGFLKAEHDFALGETGLFQVATDCKIGVIRYTAKTSEWQTSEKFGKDS